MAWEDVWAAWEVTTQLSREDGEMENVGPYRSKKNGLKIVKIFLYPLVKTFVLDAQKNHLIEAVIMSTHNICFG